MAIKAWVHWIDESQKPTTEGFSDLLTQYGVEVQGFDASSVCGAGILLCGEVNASSCEQLRDISRNGHLRVLAGCSQAISCEAAWRLLEAGASDVLNCAECQLAVHEILARFHRWEEVDRLVESPAVGRALVGEGPAWKSILRQVVEVANFTDASVLVMGESGTGKELVARLIHALDSRSDKKDLVVLDCSTIVADLSGSEFFGHERGAFTGAVSARDGAFALADGGTLFLDEIGELPLHLQTQLLRVIQEHTFKRVGGNAWQRASFRLICATNRDLLAQVRRGEFRADLYYRIASFVCDLPPLRERPEDILPLAHHFLTEMRSDQPPPVLDSAVQEYLLRREYPGNVRDLKQVVARLLCRHAGTGTITVGCIPPDDRPACTDSWGEWRDAGFERAMRVALARGMGLKTISRETEETAIRIAVEETGGNLQRAALRLGVTDRALQMRRAAQRQGGV